MKNKLVKITLVMSLCSIYNVYADNFPLQPSVAQGSQVNNVVSAPPLSNNAINSGAVPQLNSPSNQSPVDSGKILVSNSGSGSNMISSSDQLTSDLNNAKKQQALMDLNKKMGYTTSKPSSDSSLPIIEAPLKPISASMIGYFIVSGGQKNATIQYADLSSQDIQVGSLISGYKVTSISPDSVSLVKYDKKVTGDKNIKIRKSNPVITSNVGNQAPLYNSGQALDMDFSKK